MRAVVFVLLASLLFGTTGTAQAFGPADADPFSIGAVRILLGGAALALIAFTIGRRAAPGSSGLVHLSSRAAVSVVLIGAVGVIAYQPAFFLGTSRNGVAVGTIVALGSAPVLTGALEWVLKRRFPGFRWSIATLVAAAGVVLLGAFSGGGGGGGMDVVGLLGSLAAGLSYAVYTLASKRLLDAGWAPSRAMGAVFGVAAVFGIGLLLATDFSWLFTPAGATMALWLGFATVTLAYLLFASGLRRLTAPTVSTLTLAEPLTATLLGILLLGERLQPAAWGGLGLIAAGIVVLVVRRRRRVVATPV